MENIPREYIETSHGRVASYSLGSGSPALLCLHGNSSKSRIFSPIFASSIPQHRRVLAIDYPGHGDSDNSPTPYESYTMSGYARMAVEVLPKLEISEVIVLGWSLGGHVGLEMIPLFPGLKGVMMVGSPPCPLGKPEVGFALDNWREALTARDDLNADEMQLLAKVGTGGPYEDWMLDAVTRTDQQARKIMFTHFGEGHTLDQQKLCEETEVPLAIVNGSQDAFMRHEHIRNTKYKNVWKGKCFELDGLQHAPFWEDPKRFMPLLEEFVKDVS